MSILGFRTLPEFVSADAGIDAGRAFGRLIDRRQAALILVLMVISSLTEGFGLLLLIPIAQAAMPGSEAVFGGWFGQLPLSLALGMFVAVIALRSLLQYVISVRSAALSLGLTQDLRQQVQHALLGAEWRWLVNQPGARMANLVIQQAERIAAHTETMLSTAAGLITAVILTLAASALAPVFTAIAVTIGLAIALIAGAMRGRTQAEGAVHMELSQRLQALVDNSIAHLRAAKIAGAEDSLRRSFDNAAGEVRASEARYVSDMARARGLLHLFSAAALALLVFVALGWNLVPAVLLVPLLAIFARLVPIAMSLQQARRSWQFVKPAFTQMILTIREAQLECSAESRQPSPRLTQHLELRDVSVSAGGHLILDKVSCRLPAGSVTLVTGPSGAGKSTLADLLSGLIAADAGTYTIDGERLSDAARLNWRSRVAYVEQQPFLWSASVRDNLAWGRTLDDAEAIDRALRIASAEFVNTLPGGIDFVLRDGGSPLSGGEKRRLAIARALLRRPDLLILDEVFAALEPALRQRLLADLKQLGTTVIIVSHDPIAGLAPDHTIRLPGAGQQD